MKQWIRSLYTRWIQHTCYHNWEHKQVNKQHYDHEEWYECTICGKQQEVDKGTYI